MPCFSKLLDFGENYTRGQLCDLLDIDFTDDIERGVYKPAHYSTIILFSTINNWARYVNGKISDTEFLYSASGPFLDQELIQHQFTGKELLLFVRIDEETGFYYFGRCKYIHDYRLPNSRFPLYCLQLLDKQKFSDVNGIEIPDLSN